MAETRVLTGTCGYSYEEWRGCFYPMKLPKYEYLRYYSLVFPFVELDFTWYAMPQERNLVAMAECTGSNFLFSLKAHRSLTHEVGEDWRDRAAEFSGSIRALQRTGRLAAILIQMPFRFSYTAENRRYLSELCASLEEFPLAVEFRNDGWYLPRVFEGFERRRIALVTVDRPDLPGLPPESQHITAPLAYYRLHGRNAEQWWKGDATSRYDYDYSDTELSARAQMIAALARKTSLVLVAFNNYADGRAVSNAQTLTGMLKKLLPPSALHD